MTEHLAFRVRPLYVPPNERVCPAQTPSWSTVGTNKEVAGDQFVLAPSIIFAAPVVAGISKSAEG